MRKPEKGYDPNHQINGENSWCKSICKDSQKSRCQSAKSKEEGIQKMAEKTWNRRKTEDSGKRMIGVAEQLQYYRGKLEEMCKYDIN